MGKLNATLAIALARHIAEMPRPNFAALGIAEEDWDLATQHIMWKVDERSRVVRTLIGLMYSNTEQLGLPKLQMPAELVANVINAFVSPCNWQAACHWLADEHRAGSAASDIDARNGSTYDAVNPNVLFRFVCEFAQHIDSATIRADFEKVMGLRIKDAERTTKQ